MRTLIDASCLRGSQPTGVRAAVQELLKTNVFGLEGTIELATYGWNSPTESEKKALPYPWRHVRIPSKAMHALCGSGLWSFDRLFTDADRLFFPNLNIVGRPRLPYDLLVHDLSFLIQPTWFSSKSRAWHALARPQALISGAERIFVLSEWSKQDLMSLLHLPEERLHLVTFPKPTLHLNKRPRPLPEPYFLLLSAQDQRKNADVARLAFQEFAKTHPEYRLVLVGMHKPSADVQILHVPYASDEERSTWLAHAQALLYPSWYEGFGLPPHEAATLGTPTIAAGNGVIAQTAPSGTILLPAHIPSLWQAAMERVAGTERAAEKSADPSI